MYFSLPFLNYIYRIGLWLVAILFVIDILAFFYYPDTIFGDIFLATREQTPLTWLSALAMFFVAISSFSIYFNTKKKIWYFLSVVFFFFSVDDATYLHERLSGFLVDNTTILSSFPSYIWVVLYSPLLLFALGAIIYLLWRDSNNVTKKFILASVILLGFAIFLDLLDGLIQKESSLVFCLENFCNKIVLHTMRLTEEVIEVIALGIIGYVNIREHLIDK
jgi:hypothetical protein